MIRMWHVFSFETTFKYNNNNHHLEIHLVLITECYFKARKPCSTHHQSMLSIFALQIRVMKSDLRCTENVMANDIVNL